MSSVYRLRVARYLSIFRASFKASSPVLDSWGKELIIQHNMYVNEGEQYKLLQVVEHRVIRYVMIIDFRDNWTAIADSSIGDPRPRVHYFAELKKW